MNHASEVNPGIELFVRERQVREALAKLRAKWEKQSETPPAECVLRAALSDWLYRIVEDHCQDADEYAFGLDFDAGRWERALEGAERQAERAARAEGTQ